ncbi:unnamed protein product [Didymodactylos carnosus]|uniref:Uncharacterized protein n=1 Tax=Didymodactylos carnosus TaxID=1234261 RepID=A0A816DWJ3_9BILA|nr:unnamed protein product [Didymodactylos carnosus]CAF4555234.1 unnamed protein product [Didymodactylos carnosus]
MTKLCPALLQLADVTLDVNMPVCLQNECVIIQEASGALSSENDATTAYILYQEFKINLNNGNTGFFRTEFEDSGGDG